MAGTVIGRDAELEALVLSHGNKQTSQYDPAKPNGLYGPIEVLRGTTADVTAVFDVPDAAVPGTTVQIGPAGSTRVFQLEPDGSVDPALPGLGVRLVQ